jgi:protein involved in polysaccharide export with SLBB domain
VASVEVTNQVAQEWLRPAPEPFTLGPGDRIEVELLGDPSTRTLLTVGPDGKVYFYLLPGLDLWGLTLAQAKELIEREMARYMAGAQVSIALRGIESKRIWLLGRLHNSGVYPVYAPMTLLESISVAGGLLSSANTTGTGPEQGADLQRSFVVRHGQLLPVDFNRLIREGDMTQNIYLRPDDFVYVPSTVTQEIYVLGAVRSPRPIPAGPSTTLIAAIASVGGTIKDAYLSHVGIVRGSLAQPKIAVVNYKDIIAGKAPDVRLEPRDIVYIPYTPYRNLIKYADLITATFARAVAINEGARAVNPNAAPVGVNIGVGLQ